MNRRLHVEAEIRIARCDRGGRIPGLHYSHVRQAGIYEKGKERLRLLPYQSQFQGVERSRQVLRQEQVPGRLRGKEVRPAGAEVESSMMQAVQLSIADAVYATAVRDALARSGP